MSLGPARRRISSLLHDADISFTIRRVWTADMRSVALVIDLLLKELDPTLTYGCVLLHPLLKLHLFPVFSLGLLDLLSILGSEEFLGALLCSVFFLFPILLQL